MELRKKTLNKSEYVVKTISNYKKTGRTMLVVKIMSEADSYELCYDTLYSWDSVHDYGESVYNPVAYKTGNKTIAGGVSQTTAVQSMHTERKIRMQFRMRS